MTTFMRKMLVVIGMIVYTCACLAAPDYATVQAEAQAAWKARKYKEFLALSLELEGQNPTFATSFNVALGLFLAGQSTNALKKTVDIQQIQNLTVAQKQKSSKLRSDIESSIRDTELLTVKFSGSFTLSKGGFAKQGEGCANFKGNSQCTDIKPSQQERQSAICTSAGRSGSCLGLNPEEQERFLEAYKRAALAANGYDISFVKTDLQPE